MYVTSYCAETPPLIPHGESKHTTDTHLDSLPLLVKQELQRDEAIDLVLVLGHHLLKCFGIPLPQRLRPRPPGLVLAVWLQRQQGCGSEQQ